jgi:arylsulfatase A-like enzyme
MHTIKYIILIIITFVSFSCSSKKDKVGNNRPNIIFLLTDDQRWDALGAMGNTIIKTPHLDKMASNGFLFKNAYVTTSICCASRASILSGQYESRHGINDFRTSFTEEAFQKTYPAILKKIGYTIGFIGKYGVGDPDKQPKDFFDYWAGVNKHQPDYENLTEDGSYIHYTDIVQNHINNFLDTTDGKPFCLSVSFKAPHVQGDDPRQFIPNPKYHELYKDDSIPTPITANEKYWNAFPDFFRTEKNIARVRWNMRFKTPEAYQESVKNYYRLINGVDDVVGNLMTKLKDKQLDKNTIIIFMGDNGMFLGEHGLAGKWYGYEESIRVPLIIYDPRDSKKGSPVDKIALNIDIAPTILGFAGINIQDNMQGVNLMEYIKPNSTGRNYFFYEHTFQNTPTLPNVEGVVGKKIKYMKYIEHNYEELFDLKKDPYETTNLVNDPAYKEILEEQRNTYNTLKKQVK